MSKSHGAKVRRLDQPGAGLLSLSTLHVELPANSVLACIAAALGTCSQGPHNPQGPPQLLLSPRDITQCQFWAIELETTALTLGASLCLRWVSLKLVGEGTTPEGAVGSLDARGVQGVTTKGSTTHCVLTMTGLRIPSRSVIRGVELGLS